MRVTLADLNAADEPAFVAALGAVYEHSPWVAEVAYARRPFADLLALHRAMTGGVVRAEPERKLALIRAHPELAGAEAQKGALAPHSSREQTRLGFTALSRAEHADLADINRRYRETFGFPLIVALARHDTRGTVIAAMRARLESTRDAEIAAALAEIGHIAWGRLQALVEAG